MRDSHLTVRLPEELALALARQAVARDVARSHLVREAVTRYLAGSGAALTAPGPTSRELARRWADLPRLTPEEAADLARDIEAARATLPPIDVSWG